MKKSWKSHEQHEQVTNKVWTSCAWTSYELASHEQDINNQENALKVYDKVMNKS